jgi:hypothetical protein
MQRSHDEVLQSHEALRAIPPDERCAALIVSLLLEDEPCLATTILTMISVAAKMSKYLPVNVQTRISWHLSEIIADLTTRYN